MFRNIFVYFVPLAFIFGCQSPQPPETKQSDVVAPPPTATKPVQALKYPSISVDTLIKVFNEANYLDAIYYELPISMSQNEQSSIRQTLTFISDSPAIIFPDCEPIGRYFFQKDGEDMLVADFYFGNKCYAFVFMKDGKPRFGNKLTAEGKAYYEKIFKKFNLPI